MKAFLRERAALQDDADSGHRGHSFIKGISNKYSCEMHKSEVEIWVFDAKS